MKSESKAEDLFGSTLRNDIDKKMELRPLGFQRNKSKGSFL